MVKPKAKATIDYRSVAVHFLPDTLSKHAIIVDEFAVVLEREIKDRIKSLKDFPDEVSAIKDGIYATISQYTYPGIAVVEQLDELILDAIDDSDIAIKLIDDVKKTLVKKHAAKKVTKKKALPVKKVTKKKTVPTKKAASKKKSAQLSSYRIVTTTLDGYEVIGAENFITSQFELIESKPSIAPGRRATGYAYIVKGDKPSIDAMVDDDPSWLVTVNKVK